MTTETTIPGRILGLGRRRLLTGAAGLTMGAAAMPLFGTGTAGAASIPDNRRIAFDVFRGDSPMGRHTLDFARDGNRTTVDVAIDLEVKVAFVTAFKYTHRNREVWEGDRLVSLDSSTDDNGDAYEVTVRPDGDGLRIVSNVHGTQTVPADTVPSSYWNARTLEASRLLDTGQGRMLDIDVRPEGEAAIRLRGQTAITDRYTIDSRIPIRIWYTKAGQWVGLQFSARGSDVVYTLSSDSGLTVG